MVLVLFERPNKSSNVSIGSIASITATTAITYTTDITTNSIIDTDTNSSHNNQLYYFCNKVISAQIDI